MALELILLEIILGLALGSIGFAYFSQLKIFYVAGFLLFMLTGFLIWTNGGIVVGHYYVIAPDGNPVWTENLYSLSSMPVFIFSQFLLWGGLVLTAWSVFFTSMWQASGAVKPFVWDN